MNNNICEKIISHLPYCVIEGEHPKMQIEPTYRDTRWDIETGCDYTANTETYD